MEPQKKTSKQQTGKRDDTPLHLAVRMGNLGAIKDILAKTKGEDLKNLMFSQNQSGETALYVAAECSFVQAVIEIIKHSCSTSAAIKARNGFDPFHVAAKQGDVDIARILLSAFPELPMTVDLSNTTSLHTAAAQGHIKIVNLLLEVDHSLIKIAKSNGKTALHSAARNGHHQVVKALINKDPCVVTRNDNKGQTALHMAAKGQNVEIIEELVKRGYCPVNKVDAKGNTALHIASRKGRKEIVKQLLEFDGIDINVVNQSGETPLDTSEKSGKSDISTILIEHGGQHARTLSNMPNQARELNQTVSDIKHEVHSQLMQTRQTRKSVQGIAKRLNKLQVEGLNNAMNSTTVAAVLIASVAFAAIFTVPGEYAGGMNSIPPGLSAGEANIAHEAAFMIFFVFDSVALFISLAVVMVQTSVVVVERKAKKQMMVVINKLMWLACVLISVAFLALSFVVVGPDNRWMAIGVTIIGTTILTTTIGTMCYWVILHRIESRKIKNLRRASMSNRTWSNSALSENELLLKNEYKKMYAI